MLNISILITTYNRQDTIEKCLRAIRESDYKDYELIVVDCASEDKTCSIAKEFADEVIRMQKKCGRIAARSAGIKVSRGQIIINIDSDVIIRPNALTKVNNYFLEYPEVDALTGFLSKEHPNTDFFSQYKNLYMHYIFKKLPKRVSFLYGSIFAIRKQVIQLYDSDVEIADDTAFGQRLFSHGKKIHLLKDLDVVHLKKYNLVSLFKNDFEIAFDWAKIFLKYKGWKQLGRNHTGFAHSPKEQLISVILAPTVFLLFVLALFGNSFSRLGLVLALVWLLLNMRFIAFLVKEKGPIFGILAFFVTFLDNIIMAVGILCGFVVFFMPGLNKR